MQIYEFIPQFIKTLSAIERWLDKAEAFAKTKPFEPVTLLSARLAPDQYPLVRQIQVACDMAKTGAARLSGKEPPSHPDTEQTIEQIRKRIQTCTAYLKTFKPADFEGAETRTVPLAFMPGKGLAGHDYLVEMVLPNFYFHATTAYAILRHNGVDLGKQDFIGTLNLKDV